MPWVRRLISLSIVLAAVVGVPAIYSAISWVIDRILAFPPLPAAPLNAYIFLAAFSVAVGLFWIFWAYSYLHFAGRGSPVQTLVPTEQLVTAGPYAYTRNPMFLGLLFLLLAVALYNRSVAALLLLPITALAGVEYLRSSEERSLRERFGPEYSRYRRSVPALIPRFRQ